MRYKAFSEEYAKKTKIVFWISLLLSLVFIALLLYYASWFTSLPDPKLSLILWVIPISIVVLINGIIMAVAMSQNGINRFIGKKRYVNVLSNSLVLEDSEKNAYHERTFAWDDIKRILISYSMPLDKYRKNKQYIVTFIINQRNYTKYKSKPGKNRLEHTASFFYLRYDPAMIEDIEQFWGSKAERYEQSI